MDIQLFTICANAFLPLMGTSFMYFIVVSEKFSFSAVDRLRNFFPRQRQQNPASDRERLDGRKTTSPPSQTDFEHSAENFVPVPSSKKGLRHDTRFGDRMPGTLSEETSRVEESPLKELGFAVYQYRNR